MNSKRIIIFLTLSLLLAASPLGAFLNRYGSLSPSREATSMFEACQVLEGYRYYISGPSNMPRGIIGINKEYEIKSDLWQEIYPEQEGLERYVRGVRNNVTEMSNIPSGMEILGPDGRLIGYWYSPKGSTIVKMTGDQGVEIYPPSTGRDGTGGGGGG